MPKQKPQILFIHGGETFKNRKDYLSYLKSLEISLEPRKKWQHEYLQKKLGNDFDIIRPRMPMSENAKYEDWKIYFEKYIPLLKNNIILIGNSLGSIFLARYLSENKFLKKIKAVYLIAAPFNNSLPGYDLVGGFRLKADLSQITRNCQNVNLLFSSDDPVVPVSQAEKYRKKLPAAKIEILDNKNGHFQIAEFPEIIKMIKSLNK